MREISPHVLSEFTQFAPYPYPVNEDNDRLFANSSQDGSWSWFARNAVLEVFSLRTRDRCSIYHFGSEIEDGMFVITAVVELRSPHIGFPCLIVGLDVKSKGEGLVCIFNVKTSKVISAIQLSYRVTSLEVISGCGGATMETYALNDQLRYFFGILAIGTQGGHILLTDLCLDSDNYSQEMSPNKACVISKHNDNITKKREFSVKSCQHLCISLNDDSFSMAEKFEYRNKNNQRVLNSFSSELVIVSAIKYVRSLASLIIGFNFGGIQLWNLKKFSLEFSSSIVVDYSLLPVIYFTFQEPENDPRNFCYIWAINGHYQGENYRPENESMATLYALAYSKKECIPNFGYLYKELCTFNKRFEYAFSTNSVAESHHDQSYSRLIACNIVPQKDFSGRLETEDTLLNDDGNSSEDSSLCLMAWENWSVTEGKPLSSYFILFDLNQWYQAQMPSFLRCNTNEVCSFLSIFSLKEAMQKMDDDSILAVSLVSHSLSRFSSSSAAEEFFYPSSLSFKIYCVTTEGILQANYFGTQKQLIAEMNNIGSRVLIQPKDLYKKCHMNGLLHNIDGGIVGISGRQNILVRQREILLSVALEYNMLNFLKSCAQEWMKPEFIQQGCSLKFYLDWLWKMVTQIKTSVDKMCQPLFDCSGDGLDETALLTLHRYKNKLKHLSNILSNFKNTAGHTEEGKQELEIRKQIIDAISTYTHVISWLCDCKLLPEHAEGDDYGSDEVAYPVSRLNRAYSFRRNELLKLHHSIKEDKVLLIDALVSEFGDSLGEMWESKGGSKMYPPPSIYAAVSAYLIDGPSLNEKHMLMYYLSLDMCLYISDHQPQLTEEIMTFPNSSNLSLSLCKLTQSFWHLDHQNFEAALSILMDPLLSNADITPAHHIRIVKTLLLQSQFQKALKYINVRPFPNSTAEEIKLHLSVLLANGLVAEAFTYQRDHQTDENVEDLLGHLFLGCQQTHSLDVLLQLPLNDVETKALSNYLSHCEDSRAPELLILFHLLRSQPLEAANLNDKLSNRIMGIGSKVRERAMARNVLVSGFLDTLPEEQKKLAQEINQICSQVNRQRVDSQPLSAVVTSVSLQCTSYSDLVGKVIEKISDSICDKGVNAYTPFRSWKPPLSDMPFLCSPFTPQTKKRKRPIGSLTSDFRDPVADISKRDEFSTPVKRARVFDISSFKLDDNKPKGFKERVGSDILSILQTPPISRKPSRTATPKSIDYGSAPLSILKTKASILRPTSPDDQDRLFCKTPSVCSEESKADEEMSEDNEDPDFRTQDSSRPRQLRFDVPSPSSPQDSKMPCDQFSTLVTSRLPLRHEEKEEGGKESEQFFQIGCSSRPGLHLALETGVQRPSLIDRMDIRPDLDDDFVFHAPDSKSSYQSSEGTEVSSASSMNPDRRTDNIFKTAGNEVIGDVEVIEINTESSNLDSEKSEISDVDVSAPEECPKDIWCDSESNASSKSHKIKDSQPEKCVDELKYPKTLSDGDKNTSQVDCAEQSDINRRSRSVSPSRLSIKSSRPSIKTDSFKRAKTSVEKSTEKKETAPGKTLIEEDVMQMEIPEEKEPNEQHCIMTRSRSRSHSLSPSRYIASSSKKVSKIYSDSRCNISAIEEKESEQESEDTLSELQETPEKKSKLDMKEVESDATSSTRTSRSRSISPARLTKKSRKSKAKHSVCDIPVIEEADSDNAEIDVQSLSTPVLSPSIRVSEKSDAKDKDYIPDQSSTRRYRLRSESPSRILPAKSAKTSTSKLPSTKDGDLEKQGRSSRASSSSSNKDESERNILMRTYEKKGDTKEDMQRPSPYLTRTRSRSKSKSPSQEHELSWKDWKSHWQSSVEVLSEDSMKTTASLKGSEKKSSKRASKSKSVAEASHVTPLKSADTMTDKISSEKSGHKHALRETSDTAPKKFDSETSGTTFTSKSKKSSSKSQKTKCGDESMISSTSKKIVKKKKRNSGGKTTEELEFTFSEPHTPLDSKILEAVSATPIAPVPFVFSPPATRARLRTKKTNIDTSFEASSVSGLRREQSNLLESDTTIDSTINILNESKSSQKKQSSRSKKK